MLPRAACGNVPCLLGQRGGGEWGRSCHPAAVEGPAGCVLGAGDASSRGLGGGLRTLQSGFVAETWGL